MKKLYMILPVALLLCFMVGCQDKAAMAELEEFRAQVALEEQNMALVRQVFEELNKQNEAVYQEFYAPEYGWYFPANNPQALAWEEEAGFVKLLWPHFQTSVNHMSAVYDYLEERYGKLPANEQSLRNYINCLIQTYKLMSLVSRGSMVSSGPLSRRWSSATLTAATLAAGLPASGVRTVRKRGY